ncbi:hypothetical protein ACS4JF_18455 [Bacillus thuringiensis]|uniref:hypothetical protein n=1 Tax=Bacillus thuringiensis TaxID=1428 RepID=UPI001FAB5286|nr:hypothetical protein [Bacillus thuringiensis]MDM8364454.1 hypothetical protein [Bacillus thuringiensis]
MSSACTCHINADTCLWCEWQGVRIGTFGTRAMIMFPDGKEMYFYTCDINEVHDLMDALAELVIGFEIKSAKE